MEAVIFIGLQASGKSTFYRERFFNTHIRVNLDMLRTRHREKIIFRACLEGKQAFVVDNTNPTVDDRARYIGPAREAGFRVIGYYFSSKMEACCGRNEKRLGKRRIPVAGLRSTLNKLKRPGYREGFDELYYVRILPDHSFLVEDWLDEV